MLSKARPPGFVMRLFLVLFAIGFTGTIGALDLANPEQAVAELEQLVDEWQAVWAESPDEENALGLATSLQALGIVQRQIGDPGAAAGHLRRACSLMQEHDSPLLTDAREALALTLQDRGELEESERLLRQVVTQRRTTPEDALALSLSLDHLALSLLLQGRYLEVESLLEQSLHGLPGGHEVERARIIGHLGRLQHTLGSHARAIQRFNEALQLEFDHAELRLSLRAQRALAFLRLGDTEEAIRATGEVETDALRLFSGNPIQAIPYINNLGALYLSCGRPEEARRRFEEARSLVVDDFGEDHPALAGIRHNLGVALQQCGELEAAERELTAAVQLQQRYLPDRHLRVAELRRDLAVNAVLSDAPTAPELAREATTLGLELLERLLKEGSETERLNFIERFDLVSLPCAVGDPELIANTLLATKARLLDVLIGGQASPRRDWREVSSALPEGTAFIDFCRYRPLQPDAPDRYGAILLAAGGRPVWIPLEDADKLGRWLHSLRERLDWNAARLGGESLPPPSLTLAGVLRFLHQQFWEPIEARIPSSTRHLAVSLDGATHHLPLPAMIDAEGRLLCQKLDQVTRVASGRDLLVTHPLPGLDETPWAVLTVSDYPAAPEAGSGHNPGPLASMLGELGPLPGTEDEAAVLREIAPDGSVYLKDHEVTEPAFQGLAGDPAVVHFGGHAFFLGDAAAPRNVPMDFDLHADQLLASGLVLHRGIANPSPSPIERPDDDLLFPGEIARLPLKGTRLVTLSSCESGAGTSVDGEGILGLQRSFALAGAREVLVALWPIADESTPDFMRRFYDAAVRSDRPAQALWEIQREHLKAPGSEGFEESVLRYAPFTLNQSHSLKTGPPVVVEDEKKQFPWILPVAVLPLLFFLVARFVGRPSANLRNH